VPPNASTIAWCPRQTPSVGVLDARRLTISGVAPASAGGDELLDEETGVVPSSNEPGELASALLELAVDDERRLRMSPAARRRSERFDVEHIADAYESLYVGMGLEPTNP